MANTLGDGWGDPFELDDERESLVVDVEGFEGPLDLLLALARTQKVDLAKISILALAEQYLSFIADAKQLRLEVAADYLVMAAWLAYLKSRLLLPKELDPDEEPTGEELAAQLAFRLRRLEAMREAAHRLMTRNRLGRDVFARGAPEPVRTTRSIEFQATIYDLLKAYARNRQRSAVKTLRYQARPVWALKDARLRLERVLGALPDWAPLDQLLAEFMGDPAMRVTAIASTFGAGLEMARDGTLELRQDRPFSALYMRQRSGTISEVRDKQGDSARAMP